MFHIQGEIWCIIRRGVRKVFMIITNSFLHCVLFDALLFHSSTARLNFLSRLKSRTLWCFESRANRLFVQQLVRTDNKESTKATHYWRPCQWCGKRFHVMMSYFFSDISRGNTTNGRTWQRFSELEDSRVTSIWSYPLLPVQRRAAAASGGILCKMDHLNKSTSRWTCSPRFLTAMTTNTYFFIHICSLIISHCCPQ